MGRVVASVTAGMLFLVCFVSAASCMSPCSWNQGCPPRTYCATKMVPCVVSELVADVKPVQVCVPVKKMGYRMQKFLVRGCPVGCASHGNPCMQCFPEPFCQTVCKPVPFEYYTNETYTAYQACYRRACRTVWRPQMYHVQESPMCH